MRSKKIDPREDQENMKVSCSFLIDSNNLVRATTTLNSLTILHKGCNGVLGS